MWLWVESGRWGGWQRFMAEGWLCVYCWVSQGNTYWAGGAWLSVSVTHIHTHTVCITLQINSGSPTNSNSYTEIPSCSHPTISTHLRFLSVKQAEQFISISIFFPATLYLKSDDWFRMTGATYWRRTNKQNKPETCLSLVSSFCSITWWHDVRKSKGVFTSCQSPGAFPALV